MNSNNIHLSRIEAGVEGLIKPDRNGEMNVERQKPRKGWGREIEFLLSCISLSVGLGNLWRFPYACYKNGGAAFLIPYVIILFIVGKPFYFLEMFLGQFNSKGSLKAVQVIPLMKGIGWAQLFVCVIISTYYTSLIGLSLSYLISSFSSTLPWATCLNLPEPCHDASSRAFLDNQTDSTPSTEGFYAKTLNQSDDISDGLGNLNLRLTMCLLISWICVYVSIIKGIKTSGKLSYVFAIVPYIILIIILIFALKLEGSEIGIKYLFKPEFKKILELKVWYQACTQCFFSLTIGMGSIMMFSSYNKFKHNIYRDAAIISLTDSFTSILGGTAIFAVLGNVSHISRKNIEDITGNAMGVSFIYYPEVIAKINSTLENAWIFPQIMAIIFFGMLFILGVGSTVGLLNNFATNIKDAFPNLKYWFIAAIGCIFGFSVGLIYVTEGGMAMLDIIDRFEGNLLVFTLATMELVAISWIYGFQEICWDIEYMLKIKLSAYWRICWGVIMPVFLIFFNFCMPYYFEPLTYGNNKEYPFYALFIGYSLLAFGFCLLILATLFMYFKNFGNKGLGAFLKYLVTVNSSYGPATEKNRIDWIEFKQEKNRLRQVAIDQYNLSWFEQKYWELTGKFQ